MNIFPPHILLAGFLIFAFFCERSFHINRVEVKIDGSSIQVHPKLWKIQHSIFLIMIFLLFIIANIQSISSLLDGNTKNCIVMGSATIWNKNVKCCVCYCVLDVIMKSEECMCLNLTARETHKIGSNFCHTAQSWKSFWLRRAIIPFLIAHITMNFEGFDRVTKFLHEPIKFASFEFPPTLLRSTQDGKWLKMYF